MRISIFLWRFLNYLLPLPDILQNFGYQLPSKCPCCEHTDPMSHFFFHCSFATEVWRFFFAEFQLHFSPSASLHDVLSFCLDSNRPEFIQVPPIFVLWGLCRMRNSLIYDSSHISASWIKRIVMDFFQTTSFSSPF